MADTKGVADAQKGQTTSELDKLAGNYEEIANKFASGLKGKVAIVTGSNTGLGYEIATALLACSVRVVVATRNPEKGSKAAEDLAAKGTTDAPVEFQHLDLASLASVKAFATWFREQNLPLHILVNNASAWMVPDAQTEDGFEAQSASHYWGHVYLTELLKDKLKASAPSRLVWTVSAAETLGAINWDNLEMTDRSSDFNTYGVVKLYGQMVTRVFAKQLEGSGVGVFQGQPGLASTDFFNPEKFDWWKPAAVAQWLGQKFLGLTSAQGAWPIIFSAIAPAEDLESAGTGRSLGPEYYDVGMKQLPQITNKGLIRYQDPENDDVKNFAQCQRLYDESLKILNSKHVVSSGGKLPLNGSGTAEKAKDTVKSSVKSVTG